MYKVVWRKVPHTFNTDHSELQDSIKAAKIRIYEIAQMFNCGAGAIINQRGESIYILSINVSDYTNKEK